jgi:tRNA dimethylallyltransferase
MIGLTAPRDELYRRIERRIDEMLEKGLLDEVESLADRGFGAVITAKQALGYKELLEYLEGKISFDEAINRIKLKSRRFAKRQLTWFRRDPRVVWFERRASESANEVADRIESYLEDRLKTED